MNKDSFLNCLAYTGVATGTSVVALYSFLSGTTGACFNQVYSSGYNYYSGLPYNGALPLVFNGTGNQPSGKFSRSQPYQVGSNYTGDFGALISLNYSGCQNTGNLNFVLASTTSGLTNNSGVILGITPSNRLFLSVSGYNSSISQEIQPYDFAFLSVEKNRFINFGVYNLKDSAFYRNVYDCGSANLAVQNLYFGGALSYPPNFTGYSGTINEIYLFSGNVSDSFINPCIDCVYATGYGYNSTSTTFTGIKITGSYWSGIQEVQQTGVQKATSTYRKVDGSTGTIYYDSGLTGNVTVYQSLIAQTGGVPYTILNSGISFLFDTGKRYSQTLFNAYFDLGLTSGDVIEIYTYETNNKGVSLDISNNFYPSSSQEVQLFGNGLAETKNVDYGVAFNNLITGFDANDILMYDLYTGTTTMPYITGYVSTGVTYVSGSVVIITGASGVSFSYPFQYDIYFNGQKMTTGIDYSVSGVAGNSRIISSSGSTSGYNLAFFDINQSNYLELKFLPIQSGSIKRVYSITGDSYYVTGVLGFSEQVWKNGIRQKRGIDYFKEEPCRFFTGLYIDPNYSFNLYNSPSDVGLFFSSIDAPVVSYPPGDDVYDTQIQWSYSGPTPNYWIVQYYTSNSSNITFYQQLPGTDTGPIFADNDPNGDGAISIYYRVYGTDVSNSSTNLTKYSNFIQISL